MPAWLKPYYNRAETPFTVNSVSSTVAAAAISDRQHADRYISHVEHWRGLFTRKVKYPVLPSDANFMMVDIAPSTGDTMMKLLAERGVIVRSCRSFPGLADHYIRVSIGEDWENEQFIQTINSL